MTEIGVNIGAEQLRQRPLPKRTRRGGDSHASHAKVGVYGCQIETFASDELRRDRTSASAGLSAAGLSAGRAPHLAKEAFASLPLPRESASA
jgi:hypothetical protein